MGIVKGMNYFRILFVGGNAITTGFNGTLEEARRYWRVGSSVNVGRGEDDHYETVESVTQLQ